MNIKLYCLAGFLCFSAAQGATISLSQRVAAATAEAKNDGQCQKIVPFYWEIGDGKSVLASGTTGDGSIKRETEMPIASASKWVFGAYVIQKLHGKLDPITQKFLKMMSGYNHLSATSCYLTPTIESCQNKDGNGVYSKENDGFFFYDGGHFQKWAVDHGLGSFDRRQMVAEYKSQLGSDFDFSFGVFQLAGGLKTSAGAYAVFLRKILNHQLLISEFLGANPTCTLPSRCAQAQRSPVPFAWHYSYSHWVEDDQSRGDDGAFSSPGAFGFYPWIDSTKTYYGVISRQQRGRGRGPEGGSGVESALCGKKIRAAFASGTAQ